MNDELMLVEPSEEYFAELAAYRNDFLENSDSMDGCGPLRRFDDMKAYLEDTMRYTREETLPEGMVLATQFLCIRKSDNRLVGMIQVRHYLNDFLRTFGTKEEFLDLDAQLAGGPVSIDLMQTSLGRPYRLLRPPVGTQKRLCLLDAEKCAAVLQKPRPFRNSGLLPGYQRGKPQNDPEKWRPVRWHRLSCR